MLNALNFEYIKILKNIFQVSPKASLSDPVALATKPGAQVNIYNIILKGNVSKFSATLHL